ncbi:hypothetical protein ACQ4LE_008275 [Meloidogyne hapla]|uniref:Uncharacterized protein n=1 Tax=Meloidogyne hapla TaxID=6305 RepID=A0A1I8BW06_MELHA
MSKQNQAIPLELLVEIIKNLIITPVELILQDVQKESLNNKTIIAILMQLAHFSKNLLVSSKIIYVVVGDDFYKKKISMSDLAAKDKIIKSQENTINAMNQKILQFEATINSLRADVRAHLNTITNMSTEINTLRIQNQVLQQTINNMGH